MMNISRAWWWLAAAVITGLLLAQLSPILMPFLSAALLAYLGDPLVDRLEAHKIPRTLAVTLVFVLLFTVLILGVLVLFPMLEQQISLLIQRVPEWLAWVKQTALPWLQTRFADVAWLDVDEIQQLIKSQWRNAGGLVAIIFGSITASGMALLGALANLLLIPVVTFYLLRDWDHLVAALHDLLPRKQEPAISLLAREADEVLGAFFRGQILVMMALGIVYSVGLSLVGLELALLIGIVAGVVSFVPYLGVIAGLLMAGIACMFQFGEWSVLFQVLIVFGVGQLLEGMLLTPILVGDRIGLHPVAVIFAVMAGGQLFGFTGVLLALPVAAVLVVFLRHFKELYQRSGLYAEAEP